MMVDGRSLEKQAQCPLRRTLGGPQGQSGWMWIAILTELSQATNFYNPVVLTPQLINYFTLCVLYEKLIEITFTHAH
jgi:hypothetical protein